MLLISLFRFHQCSYNVLDWAVQLINFKSVWEVWCYLKVWFETVMKMDSNEDLYRFLENESIAMI